MERHEKKRFQLIKKIRIHVKNILNPIRSRNILQQLKFYEILCSMLEMKLTKNKREIFYTDVNIFKKQSVVDTLIKRTCNSFNIVKSDIFISNSLKGIFFGNIKLIKNGRSIYKSNDDINLIPDMSQVDRVITLCKICIVIEKDTIFSRIYRSYQNSKKDSQYLFICGKGYPCDNTLDFIRKLEGIKFYGIFDFDPYGLEIFIKYKYCKIPLKNPLNVAAGFNIVNKKEYKFMDIKRIGLKLEDLNFYSIDKQNRVPLNEYDRRKFRKLKNYEEIFEDLKFMEKNNFKLELEALFNSYNFDFFTYLDMNL